MPPVAELISNDGPYQATLDRSPEGYVGGRWFLIKGAASLEECHAAAGLPGQGAAWSVALPRLRARHFRPKREGGSHFHMLVEYREDKGDQVTPTPDYRTTTALEAESASETVYYDITGTHRLGEDGATKLLTAITFRVKHYTSALPNLNAFLELCDEPKINSAAVVLPNLFGSGVHLEVSALQLLYKSFRITREGDLFATEHELLWRRDWRWRGVVLNEAMEPIASYIPQDVYEAVSFAAAFA